MVRLIDANALKGDFMFLRKMWSGTEITAMIDDAPTVDAVEVVRCKDCRYHYQTICPVGTKTFDEGFCSYGERREGE